MNVSQHTNYYSMHTQLSSSWGTGAINSQRSFDPLCFSPGLSRLLQWSRLPPLPLRGAYPLAGTVVSFLINYFGQNTFIPPFVVTSGGGKHFL